jgi:hypothetical protein
MATATDEAVQAELLELERRRCKALEGVDRETLAELCDDDLVYIHGTGKVENKQAHVRDMGPRHTERGDLDIRVYGDFAVMVGWLTHQLPGREVVDRLVTQSWIKRPAGWKLLTLQVTHPEPQYALRR